MHDCAAIMDLHLRTLAVPTHVSGSHPSRPPARLLLPQREGSHAGPGAGAGGLPLLHRVCLRDALAAALGPKLPAVQGALQVAAGWLQAALRQRGQPMGAAVLKRAPGAAGGVPPAQPWAGWRGVLLTASCRRLLEKTVRSTQTRTMPAAHHTTRLRPSTTLAVGRSWGR